MAYCIDDTIVALATAPGGAVRGVVRISGPDTIACLERCFHPHIAQSIRQLHQPTVVAGALAIADGRYLLPCDVYLWPTRRSYTRQICAEIHTLGSAPLLDAVLQVVCDRGARLAEPGEFTLRAFLAGRIDLTQAEAVLGVVDAEDPQSLEIALTQLAGGLAKPLSQLRSDLLDLLADLEAGLDFADEDIDFIATDAAIRRLAAASYQIREVLDQLHARGSAVNHPRVVLRGSPNVGKSSLINALTSNEVSIVSELAGTTRDYVTRPFAWDGIEGILVDTAGIENLERLDELEVAAQHLGEGQARQANLELICLDASRPSNDWELQTQANTDRTRSIHVWTKWDAACSSINVQPDDIVTSSITGEGLLDLRKEICRYLAADTESGAMVVASTAQRCESSLHAAQRHVNQTIQLLGQDGGHELVAWELREALEALGHVVGAVYTDDILDRVFQRFCIGK